MLVEIKEAACVAGAAAPAGVLATAGHAPAANGVLEAAAAETLLRAYELCPAGDADAQSMSLCKLMRITGIAGVGVGKLVRYMKREHALARCIEET